MTLADTIREISRKHLEDGGLILGQNLQAQQNVCGTVPVDHPNVVVMPTTETAGAGIAVGAALSGRRVIHVIRFQSFLWLQASPIVNYAAKAKEIWGYKCPLFIRAIAFDDYGSGPVHTGCFHSPFMSAPGLTVVAPMTSEEYTGVWDDFMKQDGPYLVSEHRNSYAITTRLDNWGTVFRSGVVLLAISAARLSLNAAAHILNADGIETDILHIDYLKPFKMKDRAAAMIKAAGYGLVVDSAPTICGAATQIAYELMLETGCPVKALGMEDRSSGIAPGLENITPSAERIAEAARELLR